MIRAERRRDWRDERRRDVRREIRRERRDAFRSGVRAERRASFRRWDRRWRNDNRFGWRNYRRAHRQHFRLGRYYAPFRAHRYSRIGIGWQLDRLFFQPRFFINDPWAFRLPPVYGPYRWVRYYDDVLLVDVHSGQVVDVIYDFFW
ncbi:MAG: RcnB family protein [Erythrobacter sp.]|nr:MAG: protein of unknown function containing DUF3315 domain [Erythrobacteraceae bacterium HL-111]